MKERDGKSSANGQLILDLAENKNAKGGIFKCKRSSQMSMTIKTRKSARENTGRSELDIVMPKDGQPAAHEMDSSTNTAKPQDTVLMSSKYNTEMTLGLSV